MESSGYRQLCSQEIQIQKNLSPLGLRELSWSLKPARPHEVKDSALKTSWKISMGWVRNFYFLKISTVIKISTVFSLLLSIFKLNFNISECLRYQTGKTGQEIKKLHVNRIRERVSFNFGKEIQKDVCRLVTSVGYRKNSESPWGNEPQTFGFRAPMFYHWETDSTVNEVYYEVHMTCVLHTVHTYYMTWERVSFELGKGIEKDVFRLVTSVGQRNILSPHESSS